MSNPNLLCFQDLAGMAPAPETLADLKILAHSVGIAQAQGLMSAHPASQRYSGSRCTCVPCPQQVTSVP